MFKPLVVHVSDFDYLRNGLPVPKQLKVKAITNSIKKQPTTIIPIVYPHNHCINTQKTIEPARIIPVNNSSYFNIYSGHPKHSFQVYPTLNHLSHFPDLPLPILLIFL